MTKLEDKQQKNHTDYWAKSWMKTFNESWLFIDSKNEPNDIIAEEITKLQYDDEINYDSMLWYVKGFSYASSKEVN